MTNYGARELEASFLTVRRNTLVIAEEIPEDKYDFAPVSSESVQNNETAATSIEVRHCPALIAFLGYNPLPPGRTFGQAIQRARLGRGWSRKRLATECGVDEVTVKRLELDVMGLMTRSQKVVCDTLGIPSRQP